MSDEPDIIITVSDGTVQDIHVNPDLVRPDIQILDYQYWQEDLGGPDWESCDLDVYERNAASHYQSLEDTVERWIATERSRRSP